MSKPNAVLAEPLTRGQEATFRGTQCSRKVLWLSSLLVGLVFVVFFSAFARREVEKPAINMFGSQLANPSGSHFGSSGMSCPRQGGVAMSLNAMEDALKKHGIQSSPLTRFGLAQYAASRDVSRAAEAREEFSRLDPMTQAKLKKLNTDVVVRAASLKPEEMAGVTGPLGFWDPWGFSKEGDLAYFRSAELKHGRICMLAFLGIVVSEKFHPIFDAWSDSSFVSATASHFTKTAVENFWPAFWINMAAHEYLLTLNKKAGTAPGDFGFDPLNLKPSSPTELYQMQNKELNNGRLAMIVVADILAKEMVTGKKVF
jgi:hypothetical protein